MRWMCLYHAHARVLTHKSTHNSEICEKEWNLIPLAARAGLAQRLRSQRNGKSPPRALRVHTQLTRAPRRQTHSPRAHKSLVIARSSEYDRVHAAAALMYIWWFYIYIHIYVDYRMSGAHRLTMCEEAFNTHTHRADIVVSVSYMLVCVKKMYLWWHIWFICIKKCKVICHRINAISQLTNNSRAPHRFVCAENVCVCSSRSVALTESCEWWRFYSQPRARAVHNVARVE